MLPIRSLVSDTAHRRNADVRSLGSRSGSDLFNAQGLARSPSSARGRIYRAIRDLEVRDDPERQASPSIGCVFVNLAEIKRVRRAIGILEQAIRVHPYFYRLV
jgi:hypothetical protein